jgi:hypothetical protein
VAAKVTDYTIVRGTTDVELTKVVLAYIRNGWQPIGGAVSAINGNAQILTQTLIHFGLKQHPGRRVK